MRLSKDGLEIETKGVKESFPSELIIVDWSCEAVETFDDIKNQKGYEFIDLDFKCFYYDGSNELIPFRETMNQFAFIIDAIKTDAENELEKQK